MRPILLAVLIACWLANPALAVISIDLPNECNEPERSAKHRLQRPPDCDQVLLQRRYQRLGRQENSSLSRGARAVRRQVRRDQPDARNRRNEMPADRRRRKHGDEGPVSLTAAGRLGGEGEACRRTRGCLPWSASPRTLDEVQPRCRRRDRPDAARRAEGRLRSDHVHNSRQGRVHEPRRIGQRSCGALRLSATRPSAALFVQQAPVVEGTAGNTGIGIAMVGGRARLPGHHRDPRHPDPGKKGYAAIGGRGIDRGSRRFPILNPNNYARLLRPSRGGARRRPNRKAPFGPISSTTSPTASGITRRRDRKFSTISTAA